MSLNYDCFCHIAAYLNDDDYVNFCEIFNIKMQIQNFTESYIEQNTIMKLHHLDVDLSSIMKCRGLYLSRCNLLSEEFIRRYKDYVDWSEISRNQILSEDFIAEFKDYVNWFCISICQTLSEEFIRKFKDQVDWGAISCRQNLSEKFIAEFRDFVSWRFISMNQKLSEDFIREFKDYVRWGYIPYCQNLSKNFILEFKGRIAHWYELINHWTFVLPDWKNHITETLM